MKIYLNLILCCLIPFLGTAQNWEIGLQGGATQYFGDLTNNETQIVDGEYGTTGGIYIRNGLSNNFGLRGNLFYTGLKGNDQNFAATANRGFRFDGDNLEVSLQGEWFITGKDKVVRPYLFGGLGWLYVTPNATYGLSDPSNPTLASNVVLDRAEGKKHHTAVIPLGIGLDFNISKQRNAYLGVEFSARPTITDFLDGVSNAADRDSKDWFATGAVTLSFPLGTRAPDADNDGISDAEDACPNTAGLKEYQGCPDTDGDGVVDKNDACPTVKGTLNGCPDSDGDGIADNNDTCPEVAGVAAANGCPDADGDGVADGQDACPSTAGLASFQGCPDSDNDGIQDAEDECPNEAGTIANKGCPLADSDNDGVVDAEDACPQVAGPAATNGCPDSDGDGIINKDDACPNEAGTINGCPDSDKDGIADKDDACPTLGGNIDAKGCPVVEEKVKEVFTRALQGIQFETGSNRIRSSSKAILGEVVSIMQENPAYKLTIAGHTDSVGSSASNQSLSQRRADAVKFYLINNGIPAERLTAIGYGESQPTASNQTKEGRRQNRRVALSVDY